MGTQHQAQDALTSLLVVTLGCFSLTVDPYNSWVFESEYLFNSALFLDYGPVALATWPHSKLQSTRCDLLKRSGSFWAEHSVPQLAIKGRGVSSLTSSPLALHCAVKGYAQLCLEKTVGRTQFWRQKRRV